METLHKNLNFFKLWNFKWNILWPGQWWSCWAVEPPQPSPRGWPGDVGPYSMCSDRQMLLVCLPFPHVCLKFHVWFKKHSKSFSWVRWEKSSVTRKQATWWIHLIKAFLTWSKPVLQRILRVGSNSCLQNTDLKIDGQIIVRTQSCCQLLKRSAYRFTTSVTDPSAGLTNKAY